MCSHPERVYYNKRRDLYEKASIHAAFVPAFGCGAAVRLCCPCGGGGGRTEALSFREVDEAGGLEKLGEAAAVGQEALYADTDMVRVSVILEESSTLDHGYELRRIAGNARAEAYRRSLRAEQAKVTARIESATGTELDVVWNLTLAANLISANVAYGDLDKIAAVDGVAEVILEQRYEPAAVEQEQTAEPNMATSGSQIGSAAAWANGYTGLGSRIAVIDTGIDTDHQSFSAAGYNYSLAHQAGLAGMEIDAFTDSLDLLTAEEIASVLDQLNVPVGFTAEELYVNTKIPFGYNYIDRDTDVTHDNDGQGSHGSHVSGIAAANAYITGADGALTNALETVHMQGVAPDAQIITLKVFGKGGGAYESDYMAAIEDAIILGCDSVNLSLGTGTTGFTYNAYYQDQIDKLVESELVVVMSGGNYGAYTTGSMLDVEYLMADDVNLHTGGSPGSTANGLTVASVDNDGYVGYYFTVGGELVFYSEYNVESFGVDPLVTLAGEREYVYVDTIGAWEDFAAVAELLEGRIAVCNRGDSSFSEKAMNAVDNGAIGTIVCNNVAGSVNMDLEEYSMYGYTAPCVSVTLAEGELLKKHGTAVTDEEGNVLCYTGTISISGSREVLRFNSEYYTISSFSSWGVPGSLIMKPEIAAPGGSIYSVNGVDPSGTAYEIQSGTSMAAPQVSGMAAVVAEYIREQGLEARTGLTLRQLAQSLLMSTAVPLRNEENGYYWSVLQQGSGLANVGNAVTANSYILMGEDASASAADGKVKVELGDDPDRSGEYSFSFSINNFSDSPRTYTLGADIFTQDTFTLDEVAYMDTLTRALAADVSYVVDGETFVPLSTVDCDLDRDGDTDADDAQIILNYAAGLNEENDAIADVNEDGSVTTYDAYRILNALETGVFTVEAGGRAEVTVTISLSDSVKAYLDSTFVKGTYLEGYIFVYPTSDAEGALSDVTHSIPLLGFYGNWSEPSMYDRADYISTYYDYPGYFDRDLEDLIPGLPDLGSLENPELTEPEGPASYTGSASSNALVVRYSGDTTDYYLLGNPYMTEEDYPAERIATNSDTIIYRHDFALIRPATAMATVVADGEGQVLYVSKPVRQVLTKFYDEGIGWQYYDIYSLNAGLKLSTLGVEDGQTVTVSLVAIPEYYFDGYDVSREEVEALVTGQVLGQGAYLSTTLTVDDTAPELTWVAKDLMTGDLCITAADNQYIANITVSTMAGTELCSVLPEQTEGGQTVTLDVALAGVSVGKECRIVVADYAGNESVYVVEYGGEEVLAGDGAMYAFTTTSQRIPMDSDRHGNHWMRIDPTDLTYNSRNKFTGTENVCFTGLNVCAAEYVADYVFMAAADGCFYVARHGNWSSYELLGRWDSTVRDVLDMAFNYADNKLYALDNTNTLYTVDLGSGAMTKSHTVSITNPASTNRQPITKLQTLAIDDEGNFYAVNNGVGLVTTRTVFLYQWSLSDVSDGAVTDLAPVNNTKSGYLGTAGVEGAGTMAWDHDKDVLYLAGGTTSTADRNYLLTINTSTGKASKATDTGGIAWQQSLLADVVYGLYIVPAEVSNSDLIPKAGEATTVCLSESVKDVLVNARFTLTAQVGPWNLKDKTVTWTSSDESVAVVSPEGVVTTVGLGTAEITATTNAAPGLSASCTVTTSAYPATNLSALCYGADGQAQWVEFSSDDLSDLNVVSAAEADYLAGALHDGMVYAHDGSYLYGVDAETFEVVDLGYIASTWIWSDASTAPETLDGSYDKLIAICNGGTFIELLDPETGSLQYFDLSNLATEDPLAVIAYAGTDIMTSTLYYYIISESGVLYSFALNGGNMSYQVLGRLDLELLGVQNVQGDSHASLLYDAATGWLLLSSSELDRSTTLYAIDPETLMVAAVGTFDAGVAPVVSLYQFTRTTELTVYLKTGKLKLYPGDTAQITARVLPNTYAGDVVWTSSDPAVATIDADGVITAVAPGTVTLTATSVAVNEDGETASASVEVTIHEELAMDVEFHGQAITEAGEVRWITANAADLSSYTVDATSTVAYKAIAAHEGLLYAMQPDSATAGFGQFQMLDPENDYATTAGSLINAAYLGRDGTTAPAMMDNRAGVMAWGTPVFLGETFFLMVEDYVSGAAHTLALSVLTGESRWAGVACFGRYDDLYWNAQGYYALTSNGMLYIIQMRRQGSGYMWNVETVGSIGQTFADADAVSMTWISNDDYQGLLVADSGSGNTKLYFVDLSGLSPYTERVGTLEGVVRLEGLYTDADMNFEIGGGDLGLLQSVPGTEATPSSVIAMNLPALNVEYATESSVSLAELAADRSSGSTNAVSAAVDAAQRPAGDKREVSARETGVELTLTESVDTTNGLITITYDPAVLIYQETTSPVGHTAVKAEEGKLTFAYAAAQPVTAGAVLGTLRFAYAADWTDTTITVETTQRNEQLVRETVEVEVTYEVGGHDHRLTETVEATCTEDGYCIYTCAKCGETYTETIPATGHSFGAWVVTVPATCATGGEERRCCEHCGTVETRSTEASCPSTGFVDVALDDWFHEAVDYVLDRGLMVGMSDTEFAPNGVTTRAQMITVLYRMEGSPAVEPSEQFSDVSADAWYAAAVAWALENGITSGVSATEFAPDAAVTREQMVTFLYRYAAYTGMDVTTEGDLSAYTDAGSVSAYAAEAMTWAVERGIINGMGDGTLAPGATSRRAQVAAVLQRFPEAELK